MKQRSSQYFIIKLRYYASPHYLKLWHEKNSAIGLKKHHEAAVTHNDFFWKFVERVTGKTHRDFVIEYGMFASECATEELEADHKLVLLKGEGWFNYLIPKENTELIDWFLEHSKHIYRKIVNRIKIVFAFHQPTTWKREEYQQDEAHRKLFMLPDGD